jgi:hypothetical protein
MEAMARQTKPLSVKEIESAKPKEADYVLYDGDGLELLIKSSGSKIWQFRYIRPVTKKRAKSIGPYPSVTLADAKLSGRVRSLLAKQIDPRNISKNNCAVQLKPKPILSSS